MPAEKANLARLCQLEPSAEGSVDRLAPLTFDVVQDHPAVWDWRLLLGFVALGIALLYLS